MTDPQPPLGRRGGTTTRTEESERKTLWIDLTSAERLRHLAFKQARPESELVREGLRLSLDILAEPRLVDHLEELAGSLERSGGEVLLDALRFYLARFDR